MDDDFKFSEFDFNELNRLNEDILNGKKPAKVPPAEEQVRLDEEELQRQRTVADSAAAALMAGKGTPKADLPPMPVRKASAPSPAAAVPAAKGMSDDEIARIPVQDAAEVFELMDDTGDQLTSEDFMQTLHTDVDTFKKQSAGRKPEKEGRAFKIAGYILSFVMGCFIVGVIVALSLVNGYTDPEIDELFANRSLNYTSVLYYTDPATGETQKLQELFSEENREWINIEDIPEYTQKALISIEDERFYQHNGVDWRRFGGALLGWLTGNDSYGGSTITQQLIKNLTGENDRTWQRKAQEILRALYVERKYNKNEILEYYLNTVYFNYRAYGINKAAELYFNKSAKDLTVAESASLVGISNLPSVYEPYGHLENNLKRKDIVLGKMRELGYLTQEEYDAAVAEELVFNPNGQEMAKEEIYSWFVDALIDQVLKDLQAEKDMSEMAATNYLFNGGLRIYTTVNPAAQDALEDAFENGTFFPYCNTEKEYQSACLVIDYRNGHVLAVAGGRGEKTSRALNRAFSSTRQPGSSVKPLSCYWPALDQGLITEGSVIDDIPLINFNGPYPQNADRIYFGRTTVFGAIRQSLNASAAQVLNKLGYRSSFDFLTRSLHFSTLVNSAEDGDGDVNLAALSMGAFNYGVTLKDMVAGYGAIASGGIYHEPTTYTRIESAEGRVILEKNDEGERVSSPESAWLMQDILVDSVQYGIAQYGRLSVPCGGKTGTTTDSKDKWYMGFTPYCAAGVWVGYDEPQNMTYAGITGTVSSIIYRNAMEAVIKAAGWSGQSLPARPSNLVQCAVCLDCGDLAGDYCTVDLRGSRTGYAWYVSGTQPTELCSCHVPVYICDESGQIAHNNCGKAHLASMVNIERKFNVNFPVTDAAYIYRPIPDGVPLALSGVVWGNIQQAGTYPGYDTGGRTYNYLCTAHSRTASPTLFNPNVDYKTETFIVKIDRNLNGYTCNPGAGTEREVLGGAPFSFTVSASRGRNVPLVTVNGEPLAYTSFTGTSSRVYQYDIPAITADTEIAVTQSDERIEIRYDVTVSSGAGYTVTAPSDVAEGGSFEFTITVDTGYVISSVTVNGTNVKNRLRSTGRTATGRVSNVREDVHIEVTLK